MDSKNGNANPIILQNVLKFYSNDYKNVLVERQQFNVELENAIQESDVSLDAQERNLTELQIQYERLEELSKIETESANMADEKLSEVSRMSRLLWLHCKASQHSSSSCDALAARLSSLMDNMESLIGEGREKLKREEREHRDAMNEKTETLKSLRARKESVLALHTANDEQTTSKLNETLTNVANLEKQLRNVREKRQADEKLLMELQGNNDRKARTVMKLRAKLEERRAKHIEEANEKKETIRIQEIQLAEKTAVRDQLKLRPEALDRRIKELGAVNCERVELMIQLEDEIATITRTDNEKLETVSKTNEALLVENQNLMQELEEKGKLIESTKIEYESAIEKAKQLQELQSAKFWKRTDLKNIAERAMESRIAEWTSTLNELRESCEMEEDAIKEQRDYMEVFQQQEKEKAEARERKLSEMTEALLSKEHESLDNQAKIKVLKSNLKEASAGSGVLTRSNDKYMTELQSVQEEIDQAQREIELCEKRTRNHAKDTNELVEEMSKLSERLDNLEAELSRENSLERKQGEAWTLEEERILGEIEAQRREREERRADEGRLQAESELAARCEAERDELSAQLEQKQSEHTSKISAAKEKLAENLTAITRLVQEVKRRTDARVQLEAARRAMARDLERRRADKGSPHSAASSEAGAQASPSPAPAPARRPRAAHRAPRNKHPRPEDSETELDFNFSD